MTAFLPELTHRTFFISPDTAPVAGPVSAAFASKTPKRKVDCGSPESTKRICQVSESIGLGASTLPSTPPARTASATPPSALSFRLAAAAATEHSTLEENLVPSFPPTRQVSFLSDGEFKLVNTEEEQRQRLIDQQRALRWALRIASIPKDYGCLPTERVTPECSPLKGKPNPQEVPRRELTANRFDGALLQQRLQRLFSASEESSFLEPSRATSTTQGKSNAYFTVIPISEDFSYDEVLDPSFLLTEPTSPVSDEQLKVLIKNDEHRRVEEARQQRQQWQQRLERNLQPVSIPEDGVELPKEHVTPERSLLKGKPNPQEAPRGEPTVNRLDWAVLQQRLQKLSSASEESTTPERS